MNTNQEQPEREETESKLEKETRSLISKAIASFTGTAVAGIGTTFYVGIKAAEYFSGEEFPPYSDIRAVIPCVVSWGVGGILTDIAMNKVRRYWAKRIRNYMGESAK